MNLEEFGPDAKDEMSPSDYIQYCMEKYREYRRSIESSYCGRLRGGYVKTSE